MNIVMTKVSMPIIGWVSEILGWMINVIYSGLELIGITNIGLSIILFTLVVYLLMTPLQIKQQKFSKLNAVMQPEIQKIQKKYNGKKDQDSMMKQNEEISASFMEISIPSLYVNFASSVTSPITVYVTDSSPTLSAGTSQMISPNPGANRSLSSRLCSIFTPS